MSEHFLEPNVKVELDLSNYVTKADLKISTWIANLELIQLI